ncbi:MAG: hypothetical protein AB8E82_05025 [Aureispira sp.]
MRLIELQLLPYFNAVYSIAFFLLIPITALTSYHGWLIGLVGYAVFIGIFSWLSIKASEPIKVFLLSPAILILVVYSFQLMLAFHLICLLWLLLSSVIFAFNYWYHQVNKKQLNKHRIVGPELTFQFPMATPEGIQKEPLVSYFDPDNFQLELLATELVPLEVDYEVAGVRYASTFYYNLKAAPWEQKHTTIDYAQELAGQTITLQYAPDNPSELLEIFAPNYLSTFEAFLLQNFRKNNWINLGQSLLFLGTATFFYIYL